MLYFRLTTIIYAILLGINHFLDFEAELISLA